MSRRLHEISVEQSFMTQIMVLIPQALVVGELVRLSFHSHYSTPMSIDFGTLIRKKA